MVCIDACNSLLKYGSLVMETIDGDCATSSAAIETCDGLFFFALLLKAIALLYLVVMLSLKQQDNSPTHRLDT